MQTVRTKKWVLLLVPVLLLMLLLPVPLLMLLLLLPLHTHTPGPSPVCTWCARGMHVCSGFSASCSEELTLGGITKVSGAIGSAERLA